VSLDAHPSILLDFMDYGVKTDGLGLTLTHSLPLSESVRRRVPNLDVHFLPTPKSSSSAAIRETVFACVRNSNFED
jgi:hypothetical protein